MFILMEMFILMQSFHLDHAETKQIPTGTYQTQAELIKVAWLVEAGSNQTSNKEEHWLPEHKHNRTVILWAAIFSK